MENNLALKLPVIESDAELDRIRIGNSRYTDDIWDIRYFYCICKCNTE